MLPFTWTTSIREDDGQVLPKQVVPHPFLDVVSDPQPNVREEGGTWGDQI